MKGRRKMKVSKLLSVILVIAMIMSTMSISVFAETTASNYPEAEVTVLDKITLAADEYQIYDGSLKTPTKALSLEVVMNFKANETVEEAADGGFLPWKVDFYLTFDGLASDSFVADNSYLVGNYGSFGWIAIPTDGMEIQNGVTYPVMQAYDANITYKQICDSVKDFTAAIHIDKAILEANPDMTVKLELKMTNPEDETDVITIGEPAVYDVEDLKPVLPKAEVSVLNRISLTPDQYQIYDGSLKTPTEALPLEVVMNFKTTETTEEARPSGYLPWKVDFYLTFEGLASDSFVADDCYLAGNYGSFGWIAIPTDGMEIQNGVTYPVVAGYDSNITYKQICDSVKNFTAAIHISDAILDANPDMTVKLELKMTNPEDETDVITIGEPAVYTAEDLEPYDDWKVVLCPDGYYRCYVGGVAKTGWVTIPGTEDTYYFSANEEKYGAALTGADQVIGSETYDFTEEGKLIGDAPNKDIIPVVLPRKGGLVSAGWTYKDGFMYYYSKKTGEMLVGENVQIGSKRYNLGTDGKLAGYDYFKFIEENPTPDAVDVVKGDDGIYRYILENGSAYKGGWKVLQCAEGNYYKYYFSKSASKNGDAIATYGKQIGSEFGTFHPNGTFIYLKFVQNEETGVYEMSMSNFVVAEEQGSKNNIVLDSDGKYRYYIDGEFQTGWHTINGNKYYFITTDGSAKTGICPLGSYMCEFEEDGKFVRRICLISEYNG